MVTGLLPAASFTAATAAPATLSGLDLIGFVARHGDLIATLVNGAALGVVIAALVLLVGWSFRRDAHRGAHAARRAHLASPQLAGLLRRLPHVPTDPGETGHA